MIDLSNQPLNKDTFRFIVPADLEKAADGSYKIRGLASTERVDQQGETIIQKGVDLTPIEKKKGVLNWDHAKGPENTIGVLDGYERTSKGLVIEGRLFKNHTKAKAVREIMESLGDSDRGRMGLSVEGKIIERDKNNPSVILKCQISAVALTMNPVNNDTFADIIKSMNSAQEVEFNAEEQVASQPSEEAMFTATQVLQIVQKALGIGAGAMGAPDAKTGGDALSPSDMQPEKKKKKLEKGEEDEDGSVFSSKPMEVQKGGEGSRGGKVIGHTGSGKPIYASAGHAGHAGFTAKDHSDARKLKDKHLNEYSKTARANAKKQGKKWKAHEDKEFVTRVNDVVGHESASDHGGGHAGLGAARGENRHSRELKRMTKSEYIDNLTFVLDKLEVLYPNHAREDIWNAVRGRLSTKYDMTKGLRLKNTSGKEREHKLYEDARQRDDYERNKDKSRSELAQLAEESGAGKHDKEKIRAQRDAAIQAGEDRDHVRPNVKG